MNHDLLLIVSLLFLLSIFIPMIPMLKSIYEKSDVSRLYVDMDYVLNPRYRAERLEDALASNSPKLNRILVKNRLSKKLVPAHLSRSLLFYSEGNVEVKGKITEEAVLYAKGDITLQEKSEIYALKSGTKVIVGEASIVRAWIDAVESVVVEKKADIDLLTCKRAVLYPESKFKRIYADTIATYPLHIAKENKHGLDTMNRKINEDVDNEILYFDKSGVVEQDSEIWSDIICRGDLIIEKGCRIHGSIKSNGTLQVESDTYIYGCIFSDKEIGIKENCYVFGDIFSQTFVEIGRNGQIGRYDKPKSVIGIKGVKIAEGTFVHNYILTYGRGEII